MTRRVVIGQRANGDDGIFCSPPGVDAYTAPDDALNLSASNRVTQLMQIGVLGSSATVYLGHPVRPLVLIFGTGNQGGELPGYPGVAGVARPAPLYGSDYGAATDVASDGSSMYVTCNARTIYAVYNRQF